MYKVVQIWPGQTVTSLHTISPGHIWTTLYQPHLQESSFTPRNKTEELNDVHYRTVSSGVATVGASVGAAPSSIVQRAEN